MIPYSNIHTHRLDAGSDAVINLPLGMDIPEKGVYSVGVHPWDSDRVGKQQLEQLAHVATSPQVVAIGECGLDAMQGAPLDRQEELFRWHIALSERLGKPLIIHAVKTWEALMRLKKEIKPKQQWIIHGFRGNPQLAQQLLNAGFYLSIGEKYNPSTLAIIPPDRLYRETDEQ